MPHPRTVEIARRFPENGLKQLLENPHNLRDLLALTGTDLIDLIDFAHLTRLPATFVQRDYRHVESDLVLRAPLRQRKGGRVRGDVTVYILIEHQSEPDVLMPFRLIEYVVQVFKAQVREWAEAHRSFAHVRFHPVLPVVFYTGLRRWDAIGRLVDLVEMGERFERLTPALEPLFLNLPALPPGQLESEGGFFGWVLRLLQERRARPGAFRTLLRRSVAHLEALPDAERMRWLELLSYIQALVYHAREEAEHSDCQELIEASVATDEDRQEVAVMGRTIAEAWKEEAMKAGEIRARRQTLLRQLGKRFGDLPPAVVETIEATDDVEQLDEWLDRILTARSLKKMGIVPPT